MKDARVRRTQRRLRDAIVSLIHEKNYPAIAVKEILVRADVGRSAFYAHVSNKDALLASGWVESNSRLSAREVDDVFLALVVPALTSGVGRSGER